MEQYANTLLKARMLFGSAYPLITPERWMKDFNEAGFKDKVKPLILKKTPSACAALGLSGGSARQTQPAQTQRLAGARPGSTASGRQQHARALQR